jgi:hypothetical protein
VILDVFSRYVVGWTIQYRETARIAEQLLAQVIEQQGIQPRQLTVQADPCYGRPLASSTPAVPVGSIEKALDGNRVPVIWDAGDCISDFFEQASETSVLPIWRWIARIERVSTRSFEKELLASVSHVTVAAERDRRCLLELMPSDVRSAFESRASVVPNGVDLARFPRRADIDTDKSTNGADRTSVVFTGTMDYHANVTAAIRGAGAAGLSDDRRTWPASSGPVFGNLGGANAPE